MVEYVRESLIFRRIETMTYIRRPLKWFLPVLLLSLALAPLHADARDGGSQVIIRDAEIETTLKSWLEPLARTAGIDPRGIRLVIVQSDQINAFVAGGSNIFIYTGLLDKTENPGEVIGVMAHELGHINGGHIHRFKRESVGVSMASIIGTLIGGAAAIGTGVAVETDDRGGKIVYDDQKLAGKAKDIASSINSNGSYTISSYNGHILLAGQVPNKSDRDKIGSSVSNINGIKGVWNYLTVEKNQSVAQISKDTYFTSAAKSRLIAQKDINTNNIKVVTCNGIVYLMGSKVGSIDQLNGAISGIKEIDGVKGVVNLVQ